MAKIDVTMNAKGGIGKSYVCGLLAEFYMARGQAPVCFDTDGANRSFARVRSLGAQGVALGEARNEINPRFFDALMIWLLELGADDVAVVDTGSSAFPALCGYLGDNGIFDVLVGSGHTVWIHSVLAGGKMFSEMAVSFAGLLEQFDTPFVVWVNEHFGRAEIDGESFEDSRLFADNKDRLHALIRLPRLQAGTFGHDLDQLGRAGLTFEEGMESERFNVIERQRIKMVWDRHARAMDEARL